MTSRLKALSLLILIIALPFRAESQVSAVAPTAGRLSVDILIDAKVLGIPAQQLSKLGLVVSEDGRSATDSPAGFAVILPEGESASLLEDSQTRVVHSLKLFGPPASPIKFRVDTRVKTANTPVDSPPYLEIGLLLEVTPTVFPNRNLALSSRSTLQIRRGPSPAGSPSPIVFETLPIRNDIQIPEGKTILLGGFLSRSSAAALPSIPPTPGNSIVSYVLGQSPRKGDETELVVLLTPRLSVTMDTVVGAGAATSAAPATESATKTPVITFASPTSVSSPVPKPLSTGAPVSTPATGKPPDSTLPSAKPLASSPISTPPVVKPAEPSSIFGSPAVRSPEPSPVSTPPAVKPVEASSVVVTPTVRSAEAPPVSTPPTVKSPQPSSVVTTPAVKSPEPSTISNAVGVPAVAPTGNAGITNKADAFFYTVQVGAFASSGNADALVSELKNKNFDDVFIDMATSGKTPYRVRVGRLKTSGAARQLQGKLADQGFDSFLVPPNTP